MRVAMISFALLLFAVSANAQANDDNAPNAKDNKGVDDHIRVDDFCVSIYHQTINKKETGLTVKESKAIPACEAIGRYRERLSFDESLDEFSHLTERIESGEEDKRDTFRKYLLTLIPAVPAKTKTKPKRKS